MRANASTQAILAFSAFVLMLPATLLAHTHARQAVKRHVVAGGSADRKAGARRLNAGKGSVHGNSLRRAVTLRRAKGLGSSQAAAPKHSRETAMSSRVHAWVRSHAGKDEAGRQQPDGSKGPMRPVADRDSVAASSGTAKPVSVVGVVRGAADPSARPQLLPITDLAAEPVILPALYNKRGRLVVPPPLRGSHEILIRQNVMADSDGLERVLDDADLNRMRATGMLVAIPASSTLRVDDRLPGNRRYCRPWTALFLDTLAREHYGRFQTALQVNSAVRTVEFQQRLMHTNGNAAPAEGDTASPHLTGQAVDIAKHGLSLAEIAWLRGYLLPLVQQGKLDVEEEFQQSCFHISVYRSICRPRRPA